MTNEFKVRNLEITGNLSCPVLATAPSSPSNGDLYYDTTINAFRFRQNGAWVNLSAGSSGANTTLSNLTSPVAINQHILPGTTNTYSVGTTSNFFTNGCFETVSVIGGAIRLYDGVGNELGRVTPSDSNNLPGGQTGLGLTLRAYNQNSGTLADSLAITTLNDNHSSANATGTIYVQSGNKLAGTGNSGDIAILIGTSAGGARGKIRLQDGSEGTAGWVWTSTDTTGGGAWSPPVNASTWTKYTFAYTAFSTAAMTNSITLFSEAAKTMIHNVVIKHSTSFAGAGITGYTVSVGISGNTTKYASAFDVTTSVTSTNFQSSNDNQIEDFVSPVTIQITAVSTGATLDQASAGSVDVWVQSSALP